MKAFLTALLFARIAVAGPIVSGQWLEFGFDPDHFPFVSGCQPDDPAGVPCRAGIGSANLDTPPWTFTTVMPALVQITDALLAGDSFSVFDFDILLGSTPVVATGPFCGLDPNACFVDPAVSHASFNLAPGPHVLTVSVQPAQILGEGFLRVLVVPEPTYLGLFAALLGVCAAHTQKRLSGTDAHHSPPREGG